VRLVTGWRGLFSRIITDAEVIVSKGTVQLPLPFDLTPPAPASTGTAQAMPAGEAPLAIVSIRTLRLRDLTLSAGSRSVVVDLDSSIDRDRLNVARATLRAASTRLEASGGLTSLARMEGTLDAKADSIDLAEAIAIASAFAAPAPAAPRQRRANAAGMRLTVRLTAAKAVYASYALEDVATTIEIAEGLKLSPLSLRTFGGGFQGRLDVDTSRDLPQLRLSGRADGLDVAALLKASNSPGGITGRLSGTVSISAAGTEIEPLVRSSRGSIAAVVTDGAIPGLEMVRTIVLTFGKPSGAPPAGSGSSFSRLGGTFAVAGGTLSSDDLAMTSRDFDMAGRGTMRLETSALDARVSVVLSPELTAQAGTDLRRYAQQDGRVVVPATIGGTLRQPGVSLDVASAARRALENELKRRATTIIDELFKRKKKE
jgi:AsmA protein